LKSEAAIAPPGQEGWLRDQKESRAASLFRADGVVDPKNLLNNHPGASDFKLTHHPDNGQLTADI
jgi:hypothetical protein